MASSQRLKHGPYDGPNVYFLLDEYRAPLYVGVTGNDMRLVSHSSDKDWWSEVKSIHVVLYPTIEEARAAETDAIHKFIPKYNKTHSVRSGYSAMDGKWIRYCMSVVCEWTDAPEHTAIEHSEWAAIVGFGEPNPARNIVDETNQLMEEFREWRIQQQR